MNQQLIKLIKENFEKRIATKTSWGKNEIMNQFNQVVIEATLEILDQQEQS